MRGTLTCANGLYYDGEWLHGEFHGQGVLTTATGKVYEGGWAYGQRCGRGLLRYYHNGDESLLIEEYDGEWLEDMKHGAGTHKTIEGVYTGQFVYNCREGEGSMRYSDGSTYDGGWKKDKVALRSPSIRCDHLLTAPPLVWRSTFVQRHGVGTFLAGSSPSRIKKYTGEVPAHQHTLTHTPPRSNPMESNISPSCSGPLTRRMARARYGSPTATSTRAHSRRTWYATLTPLPVFAVRVVLTVGLQR